MTQPGAVWRPTTLIEVETAIKNGLVEENHFLDLKRELTGGTSATKEIAKDIAAFADEGGLILIGVDEGPPVSINPIPLDGLAERVEQIGLMAVNQPVRVTTTLLRTANDPSLGVLAVRIAAWPEWPSPGGRPLLCPRRQDQYRAVGSGGPPVSRAPIYIAC